MEESTDLITRVFLPVGWWNVLTMLVRCICKADRLAIDRQANARVRAPLFRKGPISRDPPPALETYQACHGDSRDAGMTELPFHQARQQEHRLSHKWPVAMAFKHSKTDEHLIRSVCSECHSPAWRIGITNRRLLHPLRQIPLRLSAHCSRKKQTLVPKHPCALSPERLRRHSRLSPRLEQARALWLCCSCDRSGR